ncbi:FAD-linked oxidoreductase ZEB1 like protein [Verticillium longisporum]|uniref:FAD-linked oxidoreductase ZEB1 like protein n=1 Tax=Verticillium longisporum TaxID=100787 RepID=A0A8I2ZQA8_VERLO|nr:FAD-linked oxidoreductase ZEB1 like protein [Verticillium longisporum]
MWKDERWQISRPASALWTWGSNNTCELTTDPSASCTMGYYPEFVIMAKTRDHIKAGVDFARSRNIRLVMRNTGHDFESRSAGANSLAINTHGFKDISFTDKYDGPGGYRGPTITIGAGVQGFEVLEAAHAQNPPRLVVTGESGGFIQGGGHGPLTSLHGFAADNALSFEVLTASGHFITANANSNPDLFWALKGGGPAGIINEHANYMVDNGLYAIYELYPPAISGALHVQPIMGFNLTAEQLRTTVAPLFKALDDEKIPYSSGFLEYSDFYSIYHDIFEPEQAAQNGLTGGWVFTHKDMRPENQGAVADAIALALSPRSDMLGIVIGHIFDPGHTPLDATWKQKLEHHDVMANVITEKYKKAAPDGLAYVNENYAFMNNWQDAFWGDNYSRLKEIKKLWDPQGVFFSPSTPDHGTHAIFIVRSPERPNSHSSNSRTKPPGRTISLQHDNFRAGLSSHSNKIPRRIDVKRSGEP